MFWKNKRNQFEIYIIDVDNKQHNLTVTLDTTPNDIMAKLNIQDAYLVMDGHFVDTQVIKKYLKDGSTFYACKITDKG